VVLVVFVGGEISYEEVVAVGLAEAVVVEEVLRLPSLEPFRVADSDDGEEDDDEEEEEEVPWYQEQ